MILRLCIIMLFLSVTGCAYDKHEVFQYYVQGTMGKSIDLWGTKIGEGGYGPPGLLEIQTVNANTIKYIYGKGSMCKWFFLVKKETGIITGWGYHSSPEKCVLSVGAPK